MAGEGGGENSLLSFESHPGGTSGELFLLTCELRTGARGFNKGTT